MLFKSNTPEFCQLESGIHCDVFILSHLGSVSVCFQAKAGNEWWWNNDAKLRRGERSQRHEIVNLTNSMTFSAAHYSQTVRITVITTFHLHLLTGEMGSNWSVGVSEARVQAFKRLQRDVLQTGNIFTTQSGKYFAFSKSIYYITAKQNHIFNQVLTKKYICNLVQCGLM